MNITLGAADMVVMNELGTHGVLPDPRDRDRMRDDSWPCATCRRTHRNRDLPEAIQRRLAPDTLELTRHAGYKDVQEIVHRDADDLTRRSTGLHSNAADHIASPLAWIVIIGVVSFCSTRCARMSGRPLNKARRLPGSSRQRRVE